jgi:hypothetical protein
MLSSLPSIAWLGYFSGLACQDLASDRSPNLNTYKHTVTNDTCIHISLLQSCFRFLCTYIYTFAVSYYWIDGTGWARFLLSGTQMVRPSNKNNVIIETDGNINVIILQVENTKYRSLMLSMLILILTKW